MYNSYISLWRKSAVDIVSTIQNFCMAFVVAIPGERAKCLDLLTLINADLKI